MKSKRRYLAALIMMMILCLFAGVNTHAASKGQRAISAYKKVLQKGKIAYKSGNKKYNLKIKKFALVDINQDGVKEAIFADEYGMSFVLCTYNGKKVVVLKKDSTWQGSGWRYNAEEKSLCYSPTATIANQKDVFLKVSKNKAKVTTIQLVNGSKYYKNGKKVSRSTYNSVAKIGTSGDMKYIKTYKNNASNRKKISTLRYVIG